MPAGASTRARANSASGLLRFGCGGVGGVVARQRQAWRGGPARLAAMLALLARRAAVATRCRSIANHKFVINAVRMQSSNGACFRAGPIQDFVRADPRLRCPLGSNQDFEKNKFGCPLGRSDVPSKCS